MLRNRETELPIVIKQERQLLDPLTEVLPKNEAIAKNTVLGESDGMNVLKTLPGVTPGGEGATGLTIRGGSPDQNLILLEGMPLYETYHTGSLSSIFIDESIRSIDFMKSGLPARYGGRLNSVINVQLKDGHKSNFESMINLGLQGVTFFTQGPLIKDKVTYAFSGRTSWINEVLAPVKNKISLYDDIRLKYSDIQLKLNYKISDAQKISVALYGGKDRLKLFKETNKPELSLNTTESNLFSGKNVLASINYDYLMTNKIKLNVQAGVLDYKVFSRGYVCLYHGSL